MPEADDVILDVYNVKGQHIRKLVNEYLGYCYYNLVRINNSWKMPAINYLENYLKVNSESKTSWFELGELYYSLAFETKNKKYYEKSIYNFKKAIDYNYEDLKGVLWDHLGHSYIGLNEIENGINAFKNAVIRNKKRYTYCLVQALVNNKNYIEALPLAIDDAKYYHKDSKSWFQVAICNIMLYDFKNAKKNLLKSIKLDKNNPYPLYELGGLFWNQGYYKKAKNIWGKALKLFPNFIRSNEVRDVLN